MLRDRGTISIDDAYGHGALVLVETLEQVWPSRQHLVVAVEKLRGDLQGRRTVRRSMRSVHFVADGPPSNTMQAGEERNPCIPVALKEKRTHKHRAGGGGDLHDGESKPGGLPPDLSKGSGGKYAFEGDEPRA